MTGDTERNSGSRGRIWFTALLLYLSVGVLLTFTLRPDWITPIPGRSDFLDTLLSPRLYWSTLCWPVWLIAGFFR